MKNLLLITFSLLTLALFAQDVENFGDNGYMGFGLGLSIPTGDYGSVESSNDVKGLAGPGVVMDVSFAHKLFKSNFGIMVLLRLHGNSTDEDGAEEELAKDSPDAIWTVSGDAWVTASGFVGPYGAFPLSTSVDIVPKLLIGLQAAASPELTISSQTGAFIASATRSSGESGALSYLVGLGFNFHIDERICLYTNFDYMGASHKFEDIAVTSNFLTPGYGTLEQVISTLNTSIGFGIRL